MEQQITGTQIPASVRNRKTVAISPGDTVRVHQKITEKDKTRIQVFEGIVIARKHGTEPGATFTVRRVGSTGIAVEKIFPLYSPMIDRIEIVRRTKTRRARLYFLRNKTPKQVREKLRGTLTVPETTDTEQTETKEEEKIDEEKEAVSEQKEPKNEEEKPKEEKEVTHQPSQ